MLFDRLVSERVWHKSDSIYEQEQKTELNVVRAYAHYLTPSDALEFHRERKSMAKLIQFIFDLQFLKEEA